MRRRRAFLIIAGDYGRHPDPQGVILEESLEGKKTAKELADLFEGEIGPENEKIIVPKEVFEFDRDIGAYVYRIRGHPILQLPTGEERAEIKLMKLPIVY